MKNIPRRSNPLITMLLFGCVDLGGAPLPDAGPAEDVVIIPAGTSGDACDRPLPCPEGDPRPRYARCERLDCTADPFCPEGVACARCRASVAYRHQTAEGSAWSDGRYALACDRGGEIRAVGVVDPDGALICAWRCDLGHCPNVDPPPCVDRPPLIE